MCMSMIGPAYRSDACAKAVVQKSTHASCRNMRGKIPEPRRTETNKWPSLPLQPLGDGSDPEAVLRDCADDDHVHMRCVLGELRGAVLEQVGKDQTDRRIGCVRRLQTR